MLRRKNPKDRFIFTKEQRGVQTIINVNDISHIYVKDLCIHIFFKSSGTAFLEFKYESEEECYAYMKVLKDMLK